VSCKLDCELALIHLSLLRFGLSRFLDLFYRLQAPFSGKNPYICDLHRFMRHYAFCYSGATGRRCLEVVKGKYGHLALVDEPGLPEGRAPLVVVGKRKNDTGGLREPISQPLYPVYANAIIDPGLVRIFFSHTSRCATA
jgi:hypothetical protein